MNKTCTQVKCIVDMKEDLKRMELVRWRRGDYYKRMAENHLQSSSRAVALWIIMINHYEAYGLT